MKTNLTKSIAYAMLVSLCFSCTVDSVNESEIITPQQVQLNNPTCSEADPIARLTNNGTVNFNLEIYSIDGVLLSSEYDVEPGETTGWKEFQVGETLFSLENAEHADSKIVFMMDECTMIDLEIDSDNALVPVTPQQL